MLELLETLEHLKDIVTPASEADNHADLRDPEYLTALCQVIGSPMFGRLMLEQEDNKSHLFTAISKILAERDTPTKILLLQQMIIYVIAKHYAAAEIKFAKPRALFQTKISQIVPKNQPLTKKEQRTMADERLTHFNWLPAYMR